MEIAFNLDGGDSIIKYKRNEIDEKINLFYENMLEDEEVEGLYFSLLDLQLTDEYKTSYKDIRKSLISNGLNID
jgi:hypothetical protein